MHLFTLLQVKGVCPTYKSVQDSITSVDGGVGLLAVIGWFGNTASFDRAILCLLWPGDRFQLCHVINVQFILQAFYLALRFKKVYSVARFTSSDILSIQLEQIYYVTKQEWEI